MNGRKHNLSAQEIEVLKLLMKNPDPQFVADRLNCSLATVKTHIRHIHTKLNVHTTTEAILWGIKNKIGKI